MNRFVRSFGATLVFGGALLAAACSRSTPAQPSATSTAATADAAALTASVTVPRPTAPANGAQVRFIDQPVTLTVLNAVTTKTDPVTYTFEVASDSGFASKVQTKDNVAEGTASTSVRLDALAGGRDYYWHARATGGGTTGPFGATYRFTVGPQVVINAPVPVRPLNGAQTDARPAFTVTNAQRTGPAGSITYRFEIASDSGFASVVSTGTVAEGSGQTAYTPSTDLALNRTFYWRATAIDASNNITSSASAPQSFTTSLAINLAQVIVSFPGAPSGGEVAGWPVTANITVVEQDGNPAAGGPMCIGFDLFREWPAIPYFGDPSVPIYANQWYFANIGGQWYGGPGEYLRADRPSVCKTGQATEEIGPDGGWTGPMRTWAPKPGELVGYMMSTPARAGMRSNDQRSNIVLQPWRDTRFTAVTVSSVAK